MERRKQGKVKKKGEYKTKILRSVDGAKFGRIIISSDDIKDHELVTIRHLASFGFDVETVLPSNMPGSHNPDLLMLGTWWEMKASWSAKEGTLASKFRKAVKQAGGRAVFDLRNIRKEQDAQEAEATILKLFKNTRGVRRIILIRKSGETLDIIK